MLIFRRVGTHSHPTLLATLQAILSPFPRRLMCYYPHELHLLNTVIDTNGSVLVKASAKGLCRCGGEDP
jgi:hypothetical protein